MKKSPKEQGSSNSLIVRVFWGDILYDTVLCDSKNPITIGREVGATFVMDLGRGSTVATLPFLKCAADGSAEITFDGKMEGHIRTGGKLQPLEAVRALPETTKTESLYTYRLSDQDTASVVVGYVSFDVSWSKGKSIVPRPIVLDRRAATITGSIAISMLLLFTFFTATEVAPPEEEKPERIVQINPKKVVRPKETPMEEEAAPAPGNPTPTQAAAAPKQPAPTAAETLKSADLGSLVSGLSAISANSAGPNITKREVASDQPTTSFSANAVSNTGVSKATLGKTTGNGDGGISATGPLGLAGNSGLAGGTGTGLGTGSGDGGAGLDRAVIDQIVRRRQDRIRLCYERQLNFVPGLAGKVTVQFIINADGGVLSNSLIEDTMKNKAVNDCISAEVKSWTFPRPKGGAQVKVDYPFVFESGSN
jgi:outer membrane biosynthesis protein TonB